MNTNFRFFEVTAEMKTPHTIGQFLEMVPSDIKEDMLAERTRYSSADIDAIAPVGDWLKREEPNIAAVFATFGDWHRTRMGQDFYYALYEYLDTQLYI